MSKVLIVVEHRRGSVADATFELVSLAREMAGASGFEAAAAVIGHGVGAMAETLARYVPRVVVVEDEALADFRYDTYAAVLKDLLEREAPRVTLTPHTAFGMELSPGSPRSAAAPAPPTASR